jgi:predicted anti-sigma-YlaC factor YlaD
MDMNCKTICEQFDERLDGRLGEPARQQFAAHLTACPACRQEWAEYAHTWETLAQLEPVTPSVGFVERTLRRLDAVPVTPVRWLIFRWAFAATAMMLLSWGVWQGYQRTQNERSARVYEAVRNNVPESDVVENLDQL